MSGSDACLFKLCFLLFSIPCNFFSIAGHDVSVKGTAVNRSLVMRGEAVASPLIGFRSSSDACASAP